MPPRHRCIDSVDDKTQELPDDQLLVRVTQLNRILFTQDIRFRILAETWQVEGKQFSGLIFGHQLYSFGDAMLILPEA